MWRRLVGYQLLLLILLGVIDKDGNLLSAAKTATLVPHIILNDVNREPVLLPKTFCVPDANAKGARPLIDASGNPVWVNQGSWHAFIYLLARLVDCS